MGKNEKKCRFYSHIVTGDANNNNNNEKELG